MKFVLPLLLALSISVCAAADPVRSGNVEAELVSFTAAPQPGAEFWVGLVLRPDEHWHTYWQNPGDTGLATTVDWTVPAGVTVSELHWPSPTVYEDAGLVSYVYEDEVVLLSKVTLPEDWDEGSEFELVAQVNWLACKEACVLGKAELSLSFPSDAPANLDAAKQNLPESTPLAVEAQWLDDTRIKLTLQHPDFQSVDTAYFFSIPELVIEPSAPQPMNQTGESLELTLSKSETNPEKPQSLEGVVVVERGGRKQAFQIVAELKS